MTKWEQRNRPNRLEKRFEFETYEQTRIFLERLGELSESSGCFPDISFGKTYANITIRTENEEKNSQLTDHEHAFANSIDELLV